MSHYSSKEFMRMNRWGAMTLMMTVAIALMTLAAQSASAQTVRNIQSRMTQPIAVRGGVLMLPLTAERHGRQWPSTLELRASDGRAISGYVAWLHQVPSSRSRQWTTDPRSLLIRAVRPDDDSASVANDPVMGPYLLAQLPHDIDGSLLLGKQAIQPRWIDLPSSKPGQRSPRRPPPRIDLETVSPFANLPDAPTLPLTPSPDRPDPASPFEYWRWVLLADRMEVNPSLPFGGEIERMTAEHYAALWRVGLARLARLSARVAQQCRNMLTQTCIDRRQPFATWIADPAQVGLLLSILLDFNRTDAQVLSDVVTWIDNQPPLIFWPESEFGQHVVLAMATNRTEPIVVTFTWRDTNEPPQSVRIEPGVLMQVMIDRAPLPRAPLVGFPAPPEPSRQTLLIEAGEGVRYEMTFGPRVLPAQPPGVSLPALLPPLTLAQAQMRMQHPLPIEHATFAQVRRLMGRWEVFIECRKTSVEGANDAALPEMITSFDDLRGFEAVTILLGPDDSLSRRLSDFDDQNLHHCQQQIWLTIPEKGFWRLVRGGNDGTLQIHRTSYSDRWYCRVVLPEAWFSPAGTNPAHIGFIRSHGDSDQLETGPGLSTPWRPSPARAAIDLRMWDEPSPMQ